MDYSNDGEFYQECREYTEGSDLTSAGKTNLEILRDLKQAGWHTVGPEKPRRPRQSSADVSRLVETGETALATLSAVEAEAGPSAAKKLTEAKRFQAAYSTGKERDRVRLQLLGQRNGLLRVLTVQEGVNFIVGINDRVLAFLDILLDLSANVAALTGSKWMATQTWIARNLPTALSDIGPARLKVDFDSKVAKAARALASGADLRTAPSVHHIAHELGITTHHLRVAQANRVGLTSVDRLDKKDSDRIRMAEKRRAAGSVPMPERTLSADAKALATAAGCNEKTIRRHRDAGTLDAFLTKRGVNVQNPSLPKNIYDATNFGHSENDSYSLDLNDVFVFRDADRESTDADGIVPEHTAVPTFQREADCPSPAARSDG